ncbi:plakophilin-2 [Anguilla rostrata]|uniref:plakophilin-2 n=1 Tax=Anguilla rostrata TaxID=7938 RepID=UPI0030CA6D3D
MDLGNMASVKKKNFFKSVLPAEEFFLRDVEDTSLALPMEGQVTTSQSHSGDRVQQQVQLTLARKGKRTISNGNLYPSRNQTSADTASAPDSASGLLYRKCSSTGHMNGGSWGRERSSGRFAWKESTKRMTVRADASGQPNSLGSRPCQGSARYGMSYGGAYTLPVRSLSSSRNAQAVRAQAVGLSQSSARSEMIHSMRLGQAPKPMVLLNDSVFDPTSPVMANSHHQEAFASSRQAEHQFFLSRQHSEGYAMLQRVRQATKVQGMRQNSHPPTNPISYSTSMASMEVDAGRIQPVTRLQAQQSMANGNIVQGKSEGQATELTLEKAMALLNQENTDLQVSAAQYIQHQCFGSADARRMVFYLHGVPKLIGLLKVDNEQLQAAAAGALRNVVFESNDNKVEVKDNSGIPVALQLLNTNRSIEIRKQLTGLLWNLSSNDILKEYLAKEAPQTLTKSVLIPCSGIYEGENPKDDMLADPDTFFNATGCLRNMSSSGPDGRKIMRECDTLIDSLVHYIRGSIADYIPDDKSTENCVCILHNLTYQMEAELPQKYVVKIAESQKSPVAKNKSPGCFGVRSTKALENLEKEGPLLEEKSNPQGVEWLWSPITVRMYLSLMARSSRRYSKEAALGALQNITAGNGLVSHAMACTIVKKEGGLQQVKKILEEDEPAVKRTAVALLRNLSHYEELHSDIVQLVLPELLAMLPDPDANAQPPTEVTVSLCNILLNLCQNAPPNARAILSQGGLKKIVAISAKDFGNIPSRESQAASVLLHAMWRHTELHGVYKKAGYKKPAFINSRTTKAVNFVHE